MLHGISHSIFNFHLSFYFWLANGSFINIPVTVKFLVVETFKVTSPAL